MPFLKKSINDKNNFLLHDLIIHKTRSIYLQYIFCIFMNVQHENINSKGDFVLKTRLNVCFKDFWYTKKNRSQK